MDNFPQKILIVCKIEQRDALNLMSGKIALKFDHPTRHSLIFRLRDVNNEAAWREFVEIYEPMIARIAKNLGMQNADAVDATQEVLMHLTRVVDRWDSNHANGSSSFRGWLYRVARNVMIRWLQGRDSRAIGLGESELQSLLELQPDQTSSDYFDIEFQRQIFASVANRLQSDFHPRTWQAFWRTVVDGESVQLASERLGMSVGSIYVARSRVMGRLRAEARRRCEQAWEAGGSRKNSPTDGMPQPADIAERS